MSQTFSFQQAVPSSIEHKRSARSRTNGHARLNGHHQPGDGALWLNVRESGGLRLLFISHSFPPANSPMENVGGMQRVATELHAALAAHDDVAIHAELLQTAWKWTHVRIIPFVARLLYQIPRIVEREKIDVVLYSSMVTAVMAVPLYRRLSELGVRMAAIAHGRDVTLPVLPYQTYLRGMFASLDAILPVSRATAEECRRRGFPQEKLHVIPNGINPNRFNPLGSAAEMRSEMNEVFASRFGVATDDTLVLCAAGRHVERKGFGWFVEHVMPLLKPDVQFWLAGEGNLTESIAETAARFGVTERVKMLGMITDDELESLFRGADLFVMPNIPVEGDLEGFGVVMLEAGLCGLPTVASRLEGIQDVIEEGQNGYLVQSGDPWSFFEAIQHYYHDRGRLRTDADRSARYTHETFTWPSIANRYVHALTDLCRTGLPQPVEELEAA